MSPSGSRSPRPRQESRNVTQSSARQGDRYGRFRSCLSQRGACWPGPLAGGRRVVPGGRLLAGSGGGGVVVLGEQGEGGVVDALGAPGLDLDAGPGLVAGLGEQGLGAARGGDEDHLGGADAPVGGAGG